ncbi:hypothetical protein K431DRAFT_296361 [Polychaeton citri CBS 116435]|uniref:Uncharacterized protein n=1 Tax=Polychaeton citri CBS 116435 TaxID=1314669 RepID=A0A9P4Q5Z5_9PEZI|nr:hypothetical protein K431DRAFT_296361 [Polychaeton citri CBS 116435]
MLAPQEMEGRRDNYFDEFLVVPDTEEATAQGDVDTLFLRQLGTASRQNMLSQNTFSNPVNNQEVNQEGVWSEQIARFTSSGSAAQHEDHSLAPPGSVMNTDDWEPEAAFQLDMRHVHQNDMDQAVPQQRQPATNTVSSVSQRTQPEARDTIHVDPMSITAQGNAGYPQSNMAAFRGSTPTVDRGTDSASNESLVIQSALSLPSSDLSMEDASTSTTNPGARSRKYRGKPPGFRSFRYNDIKWLDPDQPQAQSTASTEGDVLLEPVVFSNEYATVDEAHAALARSGPSQRRRFKVENDDIQTALNNFNELCVRLFAAIQAKGEDAPEGWGERNADYYRQNQDKALSSIQGMLRTPAQRKEAEARVMVTVEEIVLTNRDGIPYRVLAMLNVGRGFRPECALTTTQRASVVIDAVKKNKLVAKDIISGHDIGELVRSPQAYTERKVTNVRNNASRSKPGSKAYGRNSRNGDDSGSMATEPSS